LILNKPLDGLEGKLNSSKRTTIAKCSKDTAARDILDRVEREVLAKYSGGRRSTSHSLRLKA
jgi:Fic family protein